MSRESGSRMPSEHEVSPKKPEQPTQNHRAQIALNKNSLVRFGRVLGRFALIGALSGPGSADHDRMNVGQIELENNDSDTKLAAEDEINIDQEADNILEHPENYKDKKYFGTNIIVLAAGKKFEKGVNNIDKLLPFLNDEEIDELLNTWSQEHPLEFLKNFKDLKKMNGAEKRLIGILNSPNTNKNDILDNYENFKEYPEVRAIIEKQLAYFDDYDLISHANTLFDIEAAKDMITAALKLASQSNSNVLINSANKYDKHPLADKILKKEVDYLTKHYPFNLVTNIDQLVNLEWTHPYINQAIEKIHKQEGYDLLLSCAPKIAKLPNGDKHIKSAYEAARKNTKMWNHALIRQYEKYKDFVENPEKTLEDAFVTEADNPADSVDIFELNKFIDRPWAPQILEKSATTHPLLIIANFKSYKSLPAAKIIFKKALEKIDLVQTNNFDLLNGHKELLSFDFGHAFLEDLSQKNPSLFLSVLCDNESINDSLENGYVNNLIRQALINLSKKDTQAFGKYFIRLKGAVDWLPSVLEITTDDKQDPNYIYEIIMQNSQGGFQSYEKILHRLIPKIQPKKILEYAKFLLEIPQFDWCKDYVKKAAESLEPWEIIKYTETLIKTDKNWATQKLKEASVGAAPKYILASGKALLSLGPWAEDIIKKAASEANSRELIENRFTLLETDRDWAVPLIKSAAEKTPIEFLPDLTASELKIIDPIWYEVFMTNKLRENCKESLKKPDLFYTIKNGEQILSETVHNATKENPEAAILNFSTYKHLKDSKLILKEALQNLSHTNPREVLMNATLLLEFPESEYKSIIEEAVIGDPSSAVEINFSTTNGRVIFTTLKNSNNHRLKRLYNYLAELDRSTTTNLDEMAILTIIDTDSSIPNLQKICKDENKFHNFISAAYTNDDKIAHASLEKMMSRASLRLVENINELHEASDEVRFKSINNLSTVQIYWTMIYGKNELFTSSYNGIFNRMMDRMKTEKINARQLLDNVGDKEFRIFIKLALQYNRLNEFLDTADQEFKLEILKKFVKDINKEQNYLEQAVYVADSFATVNDPEILKVLEETLKLEYDKSVSNHDEKAKAIYGILAGLFSGKVMDDKWMKEVAEHYKLPNLVEISSNELFNPDGSNIQMFFFYDDSDGNGSFANFKSQYSSDPAWHIEENDEYIHVVSVNTPKKSEIFANKPDHSFDGPKKITDILEKRNIKTIMVVHRGHSYHAAETISQIPETARVVSLGSCGGYDNMEAVLKRAPKAHILSTKGTGTMLVNDPVLKMISNQIVSGKPLNWPQLWQKAEQQLGNNPNFKNYVPPHRNLGVLFLKAYQEEIGREKMQRE